MTCSKHREILALSVPAVIATITTPLLGLIDTTFTGHMGGAVYLAGVALGSNLFNLIFWLFGFLRMGTSGLTAQASGAGSPCDEMLVLTRSALLGLAAGIIIIALQEPLTALYNYVVDSDTNSRIEATHYIHIVIWGAPAVLLTTVLTGWFIGLGAAREAMWMSIIIDVVNIAAISMFVLGMHLKTEGVAAGTLIAQWSGVIAGMALARPYIKSRLSQIKWRTIFDTEALGRFFRVNRDIFLRTLCLIFVTLWFTRAGAGQGNMILAANAILMQLFILFSYFMDGLAYSAETLAGRATGAGNGNEMRLTIRALMQWGSGLALFFSLLYFIGGDSIIGFLTDEAGVAATARRYMPWAVTVPLVSFVAFTWDGICIGATATRQMLLSMAMATAVFFAAWLLAGPRLGNDGLWLAFILYLTTRSIVLIILRHKIGPR